MEWTFTGEVIEWRGPAPYLFVAMTPEESEDLREAARSLIYWGQVPVHVTIGGTRFTTALFPRDGCYLVPVKATPSAAFEDVCTASDGFSCGPRYHGISLGGAHDRHADP